MGTRGLAGASQELDDGQLAASAPVRRGDGDVSFMAPYVGGGGEPEATGNTPHSPGESVIPPTLVMRTGRAAVMLYRISAVCIRRITSQWCRLIAYFSFPKTGA